jgi:hypothetical protein
LQNTTLGQVTHRRENLKDVRGSFGGSGEVDAREEEAMSYYDEIPPVPRDFLHLVMMAVCGSVIIGSVILVGTCQEGYKKKVASIQNCLQLRIDPDKCEEMFNEF